MKKPIKLPKKEFDFHYSIVPRLTIEVIIKTTKGIVLSKRDINPAKGQWHIPGGTLLYDEKVEDAVDRIALEETGLKVKIEKIIGIIEYFRINHTVGLAIVVSPTGGKLRGSFQGRDIRYYKSIPDNTVIEQAEFLKNSNLLK